MDSAAAIRLQPRVQPFHARSRPRRFGRLRPALRWVAAVRVEVLDGRGQAGDRASGMGGAQRKRRQRARPGRSPSLTLAPDARSSRSVHPIDVGRGQAPSPWIPVFPGGDPARPAGFDYRVARDPAKNSPCGGTHVHRDPIVTRPGRVAHCGAKRAGSRFPRARPAKPQRADPPQRAVARDWNGLPRGLPRPRRLTPASNACAELDPRRRARSIRCRPIDPSETPTAADRHCGRSKGMRPWLGRLFHVKRAARVALPVGLPNRVA